MGTFCLLQNCISITSDAQLLFPPGRQFVTYLTLHMSSDGCPLNLIIQRAWYYSNQFWQQSSSKLNWMLHLWRGGYDCSRNTESFFTERSSQWSGPLCLSAKANLSGLLKERTGLFRSQVGLHQLCWSCIITLYINYS